MVADMFEAVAVLGVVEGLVLDFPAALGPEEEGAAANPVAREVGELVGLVHRAVGLVLAVKDHAHGFPTRRFPRVKVVGIPDFHPVLAVTEDLVGRLATEPFLGGGEQLGEVALQAGHDGQSQMPSVVQKRGGGVVSIDHHVVGKTAAEVADDTAEEPPTGTRYSLSPGP